METCPRCKLKYAKYPYKDENGKIIWKNFFKMDLISVMFLIAIIFMIWGYVHDMETCREIISDPITFCDESNACDFIIQKESETNWLNLQYTSNISMTDG